MLKVTKDKIYLTRGDTAFIQISLLDQNGDDYTPVDTDKIYFRIKKNATSKVVLLEKEIPYDTLILQLNEEDTIGLSFTTYHYEVELVTEADYHFTAIENAEFEIGPELEDRNG